jgi:hypothetical protein
VRHKLWSDPAAVKIYPIKKNSKKYPVHRSPELTAGRRAFKVHGKQFKIKKV